MGTRKVPFSPGALHRAGRFHGGPAEEVLPARARPGGAPRATATSSAASSVVKDPGTGEIAELHCTYDPETRGGSPRTAARSRRRSTGCRRPMPLPAEVRLYDRLFTRSRRAVGRRAISRTYLNPEITGDPEGAAGWSRACAAAAPGDRFQFERLGYFCVDSGDSSGECPGLQPDRDPAGRLGGDLGKR
ncbi:MAG: hypothetical protein MZV70_48750 [Desulfobacterales bacterium]|nr:hypothetical protein [Desulfobacterales bacterium]